MKRLLQVFIFSGLFLTSLAHNIERGCTHIDHFSVYSGSPTLYQYPPYDYEFFDQCISHFFHSDEDTLFLELSDTNAIFMEWRFRGQTLGKRILRLRVVDAGGMKLEFSVT